ncbi:Hrd3 like [Chlorella sorokiniana]|uniref:Hrd3 like n=1 Tax=Chlorella sorokiniana TaxID=3076 RepID=A0A2P6U1J4_CHLSO|nr:Hrd3 like [Chlorella sorokiniana]|eukprot:PRW60182.1 Hrd3 like [Chlorella sorokiniana]
MARRTALLAALLAVLLLAASRSTAEHVVQAELDAGANQLGMQQEAAAEAPPAAGQAVAQQAHQPAAPAQHEQPAEPQQHHHLHHQHLDAPPRQATSREGASPQQLEQAQHQQQQQQHDAPRHDPAEAARLEAQAAAARAAAEEAATEARRQRKLEAERQLELAEDLVGFAVDERRVDVARGVAMLQDMVARLDALIEEAHRERAQRRRQSALPAPTATAAPAMDGHAVAAAEAAATQPSGQHGSTAADSQLQQQSEGQQAVESAQQAQAASGDEQSQQQQQVEGQQVEGTQQAEAPSAQQPAAEAALESAVPASDKQQEQQKQEQEEEPADPQLDTAAHPELAPLADAAFTLAALASSGLAAPFGLPRNDTLAVECLRRAALAGGVDAQLALADRYLTGRGVPLQPDEGLRYAKAATPALMPELEESGAAQGEAGGQLRRKWMDGGYAPSGGEWEDPDTLHFEQDLAARGDPEAHRQLGYRMLTGNGLPRDLAGAHREFNIAARGGDPYAMFNLGYMAIKGLHVQQNFTKAREHFQDAAARDLPSALNGLGVLHFHGQGTPVNFTAARLYFEQAADRDHDAAYNLGTVYQGGYGVAPNVTHALRLFHNATNLGSWRAPHQIMLVLADGLYGASKDTHGAMRAFWRFMAMTGGWKRNGQDAAERAAEGEYLGAAVRYALLAEQGAASAELNLAWLMHRGLAYSGADQHRLALALWERAALRGQTEGRLMAAHVLLDGHKYGLEGGANPSRAAELFRQAAAAGSTEGLFMLGRLRELGQGLPQDTSEALRLYRAAIARTPQEAYAMAPFLALHWLRLRLLLRPLLRVLGPAGRMLAAGGHMPLAEQPPPAAAAAAVAAGGAAQQPGHRSPSLPAQWDTLLLLALIGVLTWVLWRKRQLGQQPAAAAAAGEAAVASAAQPAGADAHLPESASPAASLLGQAADTPATPPQESPERPVRPAAAAAAAAAAERRHASMASDDAVVTAAVRLRTGAAAAKPEQPGAEPAGGDQPGSSRL